MEVWGKAWAVMLPGTTPRVEAGVGDSGGEAELSLSGGVSTGGEIGLRTVFGEDGIEDKFGTDDVRLLKVNAS